MPHPTVSLKEALALQPLIERKRPEVLSPILAAAAERLQANGHIDLCCRSEDDDTEVWTADPDERVRNEARTITQCAIEATTRLTRLWQMDCGASHAAFRALQMCHLGNGRIAMEDLARLDKNNRKAALQREQRTNSPGGPFPNHTEPPATITFGVKAAAATAARKAAQKPKKTDRGDER